MKILEKTHPNLVSMHKRKQERGEALLALNCARFLFYMTANK